jgi:hypothetical protein
VTFIGVICVLLTLECFLHSVVTPGDAGERGGPMDPKLTMLFLLIGAVVGLSHLSESRRSGRQPASPAWRRFVPVWRRD